MMITSKYMQIPNHVVNLNKYDAYQLYLNKNKQISSNKNLEKDFLKQKLREFITNRLTLQEMIDSPPS